jgi:DNA replication protein DnaC
MQTTGDRLNAIWESYNFPPRLKEARFDNYMPSTPEQERAIARCREYANQGIENIGKGKGLFLHGPVGSGKSHLSIATVYGVISADPEQFTERPAWDTQDWVPGARCSFISTVDLLTTIKNSFGGDETKLAADMLHRAKLDDLVVLDDIGAERPTEWVAEALFCIIDLRYRMKRATIFTTNCSIATLEDQIGERATSRIIEMTDGILVMGPDYRKRKMPPARG